MANTAKTKARNQLIFSVCLFAVAVAGYLVTKNYGEQLDQPTPPQASSTPGLDVALPKHVTIEGSYVCLPHRDVEGPQTTECAFGLRGDDGRHYGLDLSATNVLQDAQTESRIRVEGNLVPLEALSSDRWWKYDVVGVIGVARVEKI